MTEEGERGICSSIHYMLTKKEAIGCWHFNKSDILHYFHSGNSLKYYLIDNEGKMETKVLGVNWNEG